MAIAVAKRITVGDEILQNPVIRWKVVYDRLLSKCRVNTRKFSGCHAVLRSNEYLNVVVEDMSLPPRFVSNLTAFPPPA